MKHKAKAKRLEVRINAYLKTLDSIKGSQNPEAWIKPGSYKK